MLAAHTPASKLLGRGGDFEAFRPQGRHIAPMEWNRLSYAKFHPTRFYDTHIFYFSKYMFASKVTK